MATPAIPITAEVREKLGTRTTRRLRTAGKLPGVVYGHGEAPVSIAVPAKAFFESLAKGAHLFELGVAGKSQPALLKDVQYDHLGTNIIHADFYRVDLNERVTVTVSIELKGDPAGAKEGGVLQQTLSELEIECLVTEIPSEITHDITNLKLDEALHVSELTIPAGVKVITDGETVVAVVHAIVEETPAEGEAGATSAEPEVIKREKAADDEDAAAAPKK